MTQSRIIRQELRFEYPAEPARMIRVVTTRCEDASISLPTVLVVHGFKGFLRWGFFPELQDRLARAGYLAVAVNLSGSGVGEDLETFDEDQAFFDSTPSRDVEDLERVLAAIHAGQIRGARADSLAIIGHSRGGGSALLHAERSGAYRAVVTWASVAETNRFDRPSIERWRRDGLLEVMNSRIGKKHRMGLGWLEDAEQNAAALDIIAACRRSRTPSLLIHGDADQAVPHMDMERLHAAFKPGLAQSLLIPGAGHTFGAVHPWQGSTPQLEQALQSTLAFLSSGAARWNEPKAGC